MNHFWETPHWEQEDRHLSFMRQMPFQRSFPFIPKEKGLYLVRGPRQIGKSSWLKFVLSHYSKQKEFAGKCFYLSCENIQDYRELTEVLASVRNRKIVLLDEVSFVKGWTRAVKHEIDSGHTHILMVTGSHAYDLKTGSDQMPGRFDGGGEFYLLPMLFDEFLEMRAQAGWASENRIHELECYFKSGGFPIAVAEAGKNSHVPKKAIQTYLKWIIGDVIQLGKQEDFLKELLIQFALCLQTPLSFQTLAKKTTIGSHNTVREYVSVLESCFALRSLHAVDLDTGAYRFKKDRKFYFTDPLLYWMAIDLSGKKPPANVDEKLAELVAHEHLSRSRKRFGYFSNKNGEVDFILPGEWAIETKWADVALNLSKAYLNLTLPDKKVWTKSNFLKS